ncbi:class I SAM-dependent methyltransferase [Marivivens donghaensis]|uniref:Class I SAM-dependent methyltransferase n=1 Tax=Marivivens donghaensis TaxID=1699413 RepID=A0ABX0VZM1_9RHOB|nr:class I SAM-dependent methyltransferase [Marivivens donghaensis]NIY72102.1 class I SAM-dependent methyltransferase [Marivivens donghaensis]
MPVSPYETPGFYDRAIADGKHRDIVGGRWDETGRAQMGILREAGLLPHHHLLDIGAGSLRLGCKAVPYLESGHYWATDFSRDIMLAGHAKELEDPTALRKSHLIQDATFDFPRVPAEITHAIAFAVFPHLPIAFLRRALMNLSRFPALEQFLFTVFLAPDAVASTRPYRQPDGVVTHDIRAPYHVLETDIDHLGSVTDWSITGQPVMLPRGQVLFIARPNR